MGRAGGKGEIKIQRTTRVVSQSFPAIEARSAFGRCQTKIAPDIDYYLLVRTQNKGEEAAPIANAK